MIVVETNRQSLVTVSRKASLIVRMGGVPRGNMPSTTIVFEPDTFVLLHHSFVLRAARSTAGREAINRAASAFVADG